MSDGDPLRPDAIWRIYSMTKPIVTAAAMVMAKAGLLCRDQPVAEFIPPFAQLRAADGAGRGCASADADDDSGPHAPYGGSLVRLSWDGPAHQAYVADGFLDEDLSNASFADRLAAMPLEHQPGTGNYSRASP